MKIESLNKRKYIRSIVVLLLTLILLCSSILTIPASAEVSEKKLIRVPCGINDFLYIDGKGNVNGLIKDYIDELAEINNWEYEYINTTWTGAVEMLKNGKLDILFPTNYADDRANIMDFSSLNGGYTAVGLFAKAGSNYNYDDFENFNGSRIAVSKDSTHEAALNEFAKKHNFTYEKVYVDKPQAKLLALNSGKVDLVAFNASNDAGDNVLVSLFDATPFYFAVKKGNDTLLQEINSAMQKIAVDNPNLLSETNRKCLIGNNESIQALSAAEREIVDSQKKIRIGFYLDTEPLAYITDDGSYAGLYIELMKHVKEKSGLNIELVPLDRSIDWQEHLEKGDVDFYIGASAPIANLTDELKVTSTFVNYKSVLITKNDCAFNQLKKPVIALTYGRQYWSKYLPAFLGDIEIKYYRGTKDCLLAVLNGEVDGTMLNNMEYNYQSKNSRFNELIMWENYRFSTEGGLVASVNCDPVVFSTVNKALSCLSDEYVDNEISVVLNMPYDASFADSLYSARYFLMIVFVIAVALIFLRVMYGISRKKQKIKEAQNEEHERNQLRIMAALSYDYDAIYYTNLDDDTKEAIRMSSNPIAEVADEGSYSEAMRIYIEKAVREEYREELLKWSDPKEVIERLKEESDFAVRYRVIPNDRHVEFYEMHFVKAGYNENENFMVLGLRCVDDVAKEEQQQKQLLQDALDSANRANMAKSEFLSKMSHDIRTPMNAIIGMTAIAAANMDNPVRVQDALGKITSSSRHLLALINEVLDMSKIESGSISLHEEEFNLADLLSSLINMIQPQIKEHKHELDIHMYDLLHDEVIGDELRIQQVFLNIVGNAIKYTEDGGHISISVTEKPTNTLKAARYEFVFKDDGIGMSPEFIERIFEPFSRAEDLRISKIQGTGLGMSIANNIVHMMNGTIDVESEVGKGSTFTVNIFLKLQDKSYEDTSDLIGLPVLVVDDDRDTCDMVCNILDDVGMKSEGYTNGRDAVAAVERAVKAEKQFYAVILDWKMPEMDGLETAKAIKKVVGAEIPIIILSAYDWTEIEHEARRAGVDLFISKPVFKSGLVRLFKSLKGEKEEPKAESYELQAIEEHDYRGRKVLLVEDNDLNREIAREIFEMAGLVVEEAVNGQEAVDMFSKSEEGYYEIIFMDIQMPVMNGYDSTIAIRNLEHPDANSIPIIAMTANAFVEDVQMSKAAGMDEHLAKPLEFDKLNDILKKYLGGGK